MFDVSKKTIELIAGENSCLRHQTKMIWGSSALITPAIKINGRNSYVCISGWYIPMRVPYIWHSGWYKGCTMFSQGHICVNNFLCISSKQ